MQETITRWGKTTRQGEVFAGVNELESKPFWFRRLSDRERGKIVIEAMSEKQQRELAVDWRRYMDYMLPFEDTSKTKPSKRYQWLDTASLQTMKDMVWILKSCRNSEGPIWMQETETLGRRVEVAEWDMKLFIRTIEKRDELLRQRAGLTILDFVTGNGALPRAIDEQLDQLKGTIPIWLEKRLDYFLQKNMLAMHRRASGQLVEIINNRWEGGMSDDRWRRLICTRIASGQPLYKNCNMWGERDPIEGVFETYGSGGGLWWRRVHKPGTPGYNKARKQQMQEWKQEEDAEKQRTLELLQRFKGNDLLERTTLVETFRMAYLGEKRPPQPWGFAINSVEGAELLLAGRSINRLYDRLARYWEQMEDY